MHPVIGLGLGCSLILVASVAVATPTGGGPITEPLHVDRSFSMRLSNDCRYDAIIRGSIVPARGGARADAVVPDLTINADLQCPNQAVLLEPQHIVSGEPMTHARLEQRIEHAAELTSPAGKHACTYTPDFNLSNGGLNLRGVVSACPIGI